MQEYHIPIMLNECIDALNVKAGGIYFDGTLGGGGHSAEILRRGGNIIATDRDAEAIDYALNRFLTDKYSSDRFILVKDNFKNINSILNNLGVEKLDGAILDLGISSHQIDYKDRGFSYLGSAQLDMRMDRDQFISAMTIVNEYSEEELSKIIFTYGEERAARRIAGKIIQERKIKPIEKTDKLVEIIASCVKGEKGSHPAKKTFQALRIEVNGELTGLSEAIENIINLLSKGSRLAVISFHSLEDRIVKQTLRLLSSDCVCDKSLPVCVCNHKATIKQISHKGIRASQEEQKKNKRSTSAILRIVEKL